MSRQGTIWRIPRIWPWPWPGEPPQTPGPLPGWYPHAKVAAIFAKAAGRLPDGVVVAWGVGSAPSDLMGRGIVMEVRLRGTGGADADIALGGPDRLPDRQRALFDVAMGVLGQAWLDSWDVVDATETALSDRTF